MKKLTVIAAMALLSITTMTACGNKDNQTKDNQTSITDQDSTNSNDNNTDNNVDDSNTDDNNTNADNIDDSNSDANQDEDMNNNTNDPEEPENNDNTDDSNIDNTDNTDAENNSNVSDGNANDEKNKDNKKDNNKGNNEQKETVEAGKEPDFKLNKKGCFNGSYEGNDGCTYKFTKKGKLIITSDSETLKYEYTLSDDVLSMVAEDGSFGTSRQITLLEDGTYLLDDKIQTQLCV